MNNNDKIEDVIHSRTKLRSSFQYLYLNSIFLMTLRGEEIELHLVKIILLLPRKILLQEPLKLMMHNRPQRLQNVENPIPLFCYTKLLILYKSLGEQKSI